MDTVADRQKQEREILNQLKDNLLSMVSHEFRSPMTSIKLATQMLKLLLQQDERNCDAHPQSFTTMQEQTIFKAKVDCYLQILEQECNRQMNLLNNFLDLQQLDAGNYCVSRTVVYLQESIPQVIEPFLNRIAHQQQTFHLEIADDLPVVTIDQTSLERILSELITNACKFTPTGGVIAIKLSGDLTSTEFLKTFQLKVTNSGVEIPVNECSRIFDRFYRIPNGDPWKYDGIGLGLAVVKSLVEHLGGLISVESGDEKTCFIVEMPVDG